MSVVWLWPLPVFVTLNTRKTPNTFTLLYALHSFLRWKLCPALDFIATFVRIAPNKSRDGVFTLSFIIFTIALLCLWALFIITGYITPVYCPQKRFDKALS